MLVVVYARTNTVLSGLGTTVDNDGVLDKEATSYNDIFDAFRLALIIVILALIIVLEIAEKTVDEANLNTEIRESSKKSLFSMDQ